MRAEETVEASAERPEVGRSKGTAWFKAEEVGIAIPLVALILTYPDARESSMAR